MRPGEIWPQMAAGAQRIMRASLHLGTETTLLCLRGGEAGEGELALRLPIDTDTHRLFGTWEGMVLSRLVNEAVPTQQIIRIAPTAETYRDLYIHFADDLHDHLSGQETPDGVVRITAGRLRLWGGFLRNSTVRLDERSVRGLFAELSALEQFLVPALGWEGALLAWTGPTGTAQDVNTDGLALDVKSTAEGDSLITISSIEQLDPPDHRTVRLLQASMIEGVGEGLHGLIDRLKTSAAASGAHALLTARLVQAGATDVVLNSMEEHPMTVTAWQLHRVNDPGFPRLRREAVHSGVINANYRIDLARSNAAPAEISELAGLLAPAPEGSLS